MTAEYKQKNSPAEVLSETYQNQLLNFEKMNYEEERMKSFAQWPVNFPVDSKRLAKAGFYYSGYDDDVICFSCHGHIKNWSYGDIVLKKHAELFPDCDFINNRSDNVPLSKNSVKSCTNDCIENLSVVTSATKNNLVQDFTQMKKDSERLKTFYKNWPLTFMDIKDIVQAGFFYTGIGDKVQCAYCKGMISNWEIGDIPLREHLKHFPWCDYVSKCFPKSKSTSVFSPISDDSCGYFNSFSNLSSDICQEQKMPQSHSKQFGDGNRLIDRNQQHKSLEQLGVHLHKGPVHPEQATLSARLRSFISWPSDALVHRQNLAAAGFFYTGISDQTRCFHCSGGLCRWEKEDDPWVEHARWFCNCDFLRLNKGRDFIQSCLLTSSKIHNLQKENILENSSFYHMEPLIEKVDKAMSSNLVRQVIETELFPSYLVRAAIALRIKETGFSFSSIDDLCIEVSRLKEEMDQHHLIRKQSLDVNSNTDSNCSDNCVMKDASDPQNLCFKPAQKLECFSAEKNTSKDNTECSRKLSNTDEDISKDHCLCKICMDREVGLVFLPCGHLLSCTVCAPALKYCPMCRKTIQATVRAYLN